MMTYTVKEIFYTLQGEGAHIGRPAVFLRFSGCNLWSGLEKDRAAATCKFCDTDFVGANPDGGKFPDAEGLALAIEEKWPKAVGDENKYVVCTGGEPLLQLDEALIGALKGRGFKIAVETNGTIPVPGGVDWICVSPKAGAEIKQLVAHELKLAFPQAGLMPDKLEKFAASEYFLQPVFDEHVHENTRLAISYCMENPRWRLSVQMHKLVGLR
jgi:7-carboxy-7-deazaguanine synthase